MNTRNEQGAVASDDAGEGFFEGEAPDQAPVSEQQEAQPPEQPVAEETGVEDQPGVEDAPVDPAQQGRVKAVKAERQKRQAVETQLETIQRENAEYKERLARLEGMQAAQQYQQPQPQPQQPEQIPDPVDDPQGYANAMQQRIAQQTINTMQNNDRASAEMLHGRDRLNGLYLEWQQMKATGTLPPELSALHTSGNPYSTLVHWDESRKRQQEAFEVHKTFGADEARHEWAKSQGYVLSPNAARQAVPGQKMPTDITQSPGSAKPARPDPDDAFFS